MKLLIAGSRGIEAFDLAPYIPQDTDTILSGGAKGIDTLAESYDDKRKLSKIILRPRYDLYKKGAPLKRNQALVEMADQILIIWDGSSPGTKSTIKYAQKLRKDIKIITTEQSGYAARRRRRPEQ